MNRVQSRRRWVQYLAPKRREFIICLCGAETQNITITWQNYWWRKRIGGRGLCRTWGCFSSWKYVVKAQKPGDLRIPSRDARHLIAAFRVTVPVVTYVHWKCLLGELVVIRCITTGGLVGVPVDLRTPGVYDVMVCVIQLVVSVMQLLTVSSR
jgi:hypothetical protein